MNQHPQDNLVVALGSNDVSSESMSMASDRLGGGEHPDGLHRDHHGQGERGYAALLELLEGPLPSVEPGGEGQRCSGG